MWWFDIGCINKLYLNTNRVLLIKYTSKGHIKSQSCLVGKKRGGGSTYPLAQRKPLSPIYLIAAVVCFFFFWKKLFIETTNQLCLPLVAFTFCLFLAFSIRVVSSSFVHISFFVHVVDLISPDIILRSTNLMT